jgi:hypothetical protein
LKIFEGTPSKKSSRLTRMSGVSPKSSHKYGGLPLPRVNSTVNEIKGSLNAKPLLSPKPVMSPEKNIPKSQSPRKVPLTPFSSDVQHSTPSPALSSRILTQGTMSSALSPLVSPTESARLKSPSPTETGRKITGIPVSQLDDPAPMTNGKITTQDTVAEESSNTSDEDDDGSADAVDGSTKPISSSALDNIRKDGMSVDFIFGNSSASTKPKSYLPGAKSYLPGGKTAVISQGLTRSQKITSPVFQRQDFETASKSTSVPPVAKSPDLPQTQIKQVGVIRPIVNNAHSTSPPPLLTDLEIEKNFINRTKSIEQPTSKVVVSLKPANEIVGKVSMEPQRARTDDSVKIVRDVVTLTGTSDSKASGLWDNKPWNQPQNTMVFNFSGRKGPVPSYIENDGLILSSRRTNSVVSLFFQFC